MSVSSGNDHCVQPRTQPGGPRTLPPEPMGALAPAQPANEVRLGAERRLRESERQELAWPGARWDLRGQNKSIGNPRTEKATAESCRQLHRCQLPSDPDLSPRSLWSGVHPFPVSTVYSVLREHSTTTDTSLSKHWHFNQNTPWARSVWLSG